MAQNFSEKHWGTWESRLPQMGILFDQIGDRIFWEVFHVHLDVQKSLEHWDRPWELISLIDDCLRGVKCLYIYLEVM